MSHDSSATDLQVPSGDWHRPLAFFVILVSAVMSAILFSSGHTVGFLVTGFILMVAFASMLPTFVGEYRGLFLLFLGLTLVGYWAGRHTLTEGRAVSLVLASTFATVALLLLVAVGAWISARWILALHEHEGVTVSQAWLYLACLMTGIHQSYQIIEDGEVVMTKPKGILSSIGGPGVAVIRPENAAAFECGGKVTQIAGPGIVPIRRFEKIRKILDLRPRWESRQAQNVLTRDRVPLTISFGVGFQLCRDTRTDGLPLDEQMQQVYPVNKHDLFRAAYKLSGPWQVLPAAVADNLLRRATATYSYNELTNWEPGIAKPLEQRLDSAPIKTIEQHIMDRLREAAIAWGMQITAFMIKGIEIPEQVREEVTLGRYREEMTVTEARAQATALEEVSGAKIDAWGAMLDRVLDTLKNAGTGHDGRIAAEYVTMLRRIELLEELVRQGKLQLPYAPGPEHLSYE